MLAKLVLSYEQVEVRATRNSQSRSGLNPETLPEPNPANPANPALNPDYVGANFLEKVSYTGI